MNRARTIGALLATGLAAMLLTGCLTGAIDPPAGYPKIGDANLYGERYLSGEHVAVAWRVLDNPKGATEAFWMHAIRQELVETQGYTLKECGPIKAGRQAGTLFDFRTTVGSVEHTYLLATFAQAERIGVVEAAGRSDKVAADREAILKAMRSFR